MVEQTDVHTDSEDNVTVVVFDGCLYPSPPKSIKISLPMSLTGEDFINKISEEYGYPKEHFEAKWKSDSIHSEEQKTLRELGFVKKEVVTIYKRQGVKEIESTKAKIPSMLTNYDNNKAVVPSSASSSSSSSSSSNSQLVPTYGPSNSPYSYPSTGGYTSSYSSYPWSQSSGKSSTGYIGLSNQGATCYMNSLIQTLYMTPEFRNALYNWSFDEKFRSDVAKQKEKEREKENGNGAAPNGSASEKEKENGNGKPIENGNGEIITQEEREKKEKTSIPLQLQRLFARLQLCDVQAVKTKDLTKSFGWEDADSFTQHDVQELCRVLFDALERNFQGTKQANLVNELYQGKMKDYVQCKECKHESARVDHYLDIPLVIRGFGETIPVRSVEEALHKFVQPEVLDKENQYNCEKCAKKVDAIKGLKIEKFPYLLTLQLKRFDFDFQNMRRVKLNDRVTFPLYLDLNPLIHGKSAPTQKKNNGFDENNENDENVDEEEEEDDDDEEEREEKGKGRFDEDDDARPQPRGNEMDIEEEGDEVRVRNHKKKKDPFDVEPDFDGPPPVVTPELPYVYELFSVMIHRGSSMGGHYYAYVKSFETNKWYEFNDSVVTEISVSEVKKAFGGDEEGGIGYSMPRNAYSSYRSNANAYMLMYRQIVPDRNKKPIAADEIPTAIKKVVDDENGAAKLKKKAEELEREMVKLKIYYNGEDKPLNMHKSASLNDTAKAAVNLFGLSEKFSPQNYRLRGYSHYNDLPGETFTGKESKSLEDLNFYAYSYSAKSLLLETKEAAEEFDDYNPSNLLFRVAKYNPTTLDFDPVVNVYVNRNGTFGDLREAIGSKLGIPANKMNLYREPVYSPPASLLEKANDVDLRSTHISEPEKLYVEYTEKPLGSYDSDEDEDDDNKKENEDDEKDEKDDDKDERDEKSRREKEKEKEKEESPVIAALERIKNIIEVKFNLPGKETADQKVSVDKNMLVKDFKLKIQPVVGLPLDDFKIKRGSAPHLYELSNENESLSDFSVHDGMSLTIEKGKPLKEGETIYTFEFFDLTKDSDHFNDLFDLAIHEDMLVSDVKKTIFPMLQEKGIKVADPANIRLREISSAPSRRIGKVFPDALTVKKAMVYVYSKRMLVQVIEGSETVVNQEKDICFFIQLFKPSKFELTRKEDFVISEDASLDELREKLGEKYDIPAANVGILRVDAFYNFHDDPDLLDIPTMSWDRPTIAYSMGDTMMMRHGYLLLVRDNTEQLKELTKEETDVIKKETMKRKNASNSNSSYSFWNRKERALKIQSEG